MHFGDKSAESAKLKRENCYIQIFTANITPRPLNVFLFLTYINFLKLKLSLFLVTTLVRRIHLKGLYHR
jgi:hypothetical protein